MTSKRPCGYIFAVSKISSHMHEFFNFFMKWLKSKTQNWVKSEIGNDTRIMCHSQEICVLKMHYIYIRVMKMGAETRCPQLGNFYTLCMPTGWMGRGKY